MFDVIIIGGGVIGCSAARELTKWNARILLLESNEDVCEGTSKANSGIVHAGYDAVPGTRKAYFNVLGNQMMGEICRELDVPFSQEGSFVLAESEEDRDTIERLYQQGVANGVRGLRVMDQEEIRKLEPNVAETVSYGLFAPTGGIVCPFTLTIAMGENAVKNGAVFQLGEKVRSIQKEGQVYRVKTSKGEYTAKAIVNAAGVYADEIHNQISAQKIKIIPRKGEYQLLDKNISGLIRHTLFQVPTKMGKGVLVTPTVHHNLLLGPTATNISDKEATNTTQDGLTFIQQAVNRSIDFGYGRDIITSFAGLRAHEEGGDFIVGEVQDAPGFFDAAGIESPGLTAAPAIGTFIAENISAFLKLEKNSKFNPIRKGIHQFIELREEEQKQLIQSNSAYGNMVCRCEMITEGEILEAIHRPLGAKTLDGVKRRTRAGMGRCQAGFCTSRIMDILSRECSLEKDTICKNESGSNLLVGKTKEEVAL